MDAATGAVGTLSATSDANAYPTGISATGAVSNLLIWGEIDVSQDPDWTGITDSQSPGWTDVAA